MKKLFFMFLMAFAAISIIGCNNLNTKSPTTAIGSDLESDPQFVGVADVVVEKGTADFDVLSGISVVDDKDNDLLASVIITGEVDLTVVAEYPITLTVTDSDGNVASASFVVSVEASQDETEALADIAAIKIIENSKGNFTLPTFGEVNSSMIVWETSNPEVVTKKGYVIKPGIGEQPVEVVLTATVIKGDYRTNVEFDVVVNPNEELEAITSKVSLPFEGTSTEYVVQNQDAVDIYFADGGDLPYIDIKTFMDLIEGAIESSLINYFPIGEDQLRIEYEVEFEDFDGTMATESFWALVDFTENTFTVSNYSFFENYVSETTSDYGEGLNYVDADYVDGTEVTIPLGFYNFDLLMHQDNDQTLYLMPLHVANLLFAGNIYYDVYYNGVKLWGVDTFTISGGDTPESLSILQSIRTSSYNYLDIPTDVRWATYNFLALSMDYFYGLNEKFTGSYYEILNRYNGDLIYGDDVSIYRKIFEIANGLNDLHTSHVFTGYFNSPFSISLSLGDLGSDVVAFYQGYWAMTDKFAAKFGEDVDGYPIIPTEARLIDNDKTAIIYLTGFEIETPDQIKLILDSLPATVENVVIDLAYNTGGNLGAVLRIFGYMTDNPIIYHSQNPADGAKVSYYIESDYAAYDYNWFIVTSSVTFSAANLMSSIAKEQGLATVIGQDSSGGASSIGAIYTPDGSCLLISTNNVLSTRIDGEYFSIEDGVEVEHYMNDVTSDSELIEIINQVNAAN